MNAAAVADPEAREFLRNADPVLAQVIDAHPDFHPRAWIDELPGLDAFRKDQPSALLTFYRKSGDLRENLSIDQEDFESQPVFTHYGGWGRASSVFAGQLPELIQQLNLAIAA